MTDSELCSVCGLPKSLHEGLATSLTLVFVDGRWVIDPKHEFCPWTDGGNGDQCYRCRHTRDLHGGTARGHGCYAFPCSVRWRTLLGLRSRCPVFDPKRRMYS